MRQNPWNAVITLGHANGAAARWILTLYSLDLDFLFNAGTATMWSPNMSAPLVKMLCHRGPVNPDLNH